MNASAEKAPDNSPARKKMRPWQHVVHWVLILLVLATCYWAAKTVKRIMAGPQNDTAPQHASPGEDFLFQALDESPEPGYWEFQNQEWAIAQTKLRAADFEAHLLERLKSSTENTPAHQKLLQHFKSLGTPAALGKNATIYRASKTGGPFAVTVGNQDAEQLIVVGIVMPENNEAWQVLEMLPTPAKAGKPKDSSESLLPLPTNGKRLMARWSNAGELMLEWVRVPVPAREMVSQWQAAGLKLRPTAGMLGAEQSYLYEQEGEVIIVNVFPSTEGGTDLLIARSSDVIPASNGN